MGQKIDPDLWSDDAEPHLMGGRRADGEIVFPMPLGVAAQDCEPYKLSRIGKLWSWTTQGFLPKTPYIGPGSNEGPDGEPSPPDFQPFLLGYVELPGEVIVESRIVGASLEDLELNMPVEFCIVPFNETYDTFAFRPISSSLSEAA